MNSQIFKNKIPNELLVTLIENNAIKTFSIKSAAWLKNLTVGWHKYHSIGQVMW